LADQLGMGVIGCGSIAGAHLPAEQALDEIATVAVCDLDEQAARQRAEEFEVATIYRDYHDLLADDNVDAVAILLPHHLHRDCAVAAAQAGKHILCEKPMAISIAETDDMIAAAEEAGVVLMIAQVLRFRPANIRARELIRDGAIGEVKNVIRRRYGKSGDPGRDWALKPEEAGGWVLYGYGAHEIDMILWLNDAEAHEVYAQAQRNNPAWHDYDEISIEMRLSNEAIASMHHTVNSPVSAWDCLVIGTQGGMLIESERILLNGETMEVPLDGSATHRVQTAEFAAAVFEGREPEASGRDVRKTMAALEAAKLSIAQGRVVDASEL